MKTKKKRSSPQIGADFGQYYGNLSQKVGEDQNKKKGFRPGISSLFSPQIRTEFGRTKQKKILVWNFLFPRKCKVSLSMRKSTAKKDLAGHTKQLRGPNVAHGPRVGQPSLMAMKTIICLSFIVENNFFANMCVKKNCASPTKSLTARHCNRTTEHMSNTKLKNYFRVN